MRRRLILVVLASTSLVVVAFAIPLAGLVRTVARDRAISAAERDLAALAPVLALTDNPALVEAAVAQTGTGSTGLLGVWLPDGTEIGATAGADPSSISLARTQGRSFTQDVPGGIDLFGAVVIGDGETVVLRAHVPDAALTDGVVTAWLALGAVALALLAAATLLALRLARSLTSGASSLAATARELAHGVPTARAATGPIPELADAATALNLLADRIDELRAAERERVADLSHRLRTPLTALRLDADAAGDRSVIDGVARLETAVTELVRSARLPLHPSPVGAVCDVSAVVRERAEFWSALADDDGRGWELDVDPAAATIRAAVAPDELHAAVDALLGNVFTHTPPGTDYRIVLRASGGEVTLTVEDAGPGIADHSLLERGATAAGSTGLGLDIARQMAERHGGSLAVGRSDLGGASVTLRFESRGVDQSSS